LQKTVQQNSEELALTVAMNGPLGDVFFFGFGTVDGNLVGMIPLGLHTYQLNSIGVISCIVRPLTTTTATVTATATKTKTATATSS